ncbi:hypothetical protein [Sulfuricurvum sp.]|uniref:hypothetical protein n=1 Tax=Sulfuricurvum sp. TaxID=2025608 RepID=UPI003BB78BA5
MKSKNFTAIVLLVTSFTVFTGCTTANYGLKPTSVENQKDTYTFKVYVGGLAGPETADQSLAGDLESYKTKNGYKSYTIKDRRYNFIPTYYEYTVQFSH